MFESGAMPDNSDTAKAGKRRTVRKPAAPTAPSRGAAHATPPDHATAETAKEASMTDTIDHAPSDTHPAPTSELDAKAESLIKSYTIATMAITTVPVPVFEFVAVSAVQLRLIQQLAHLYEKPFGKEIGVSVLSSLLTTIGGALGTYAAAGLLRLVPVVGPALSLASGPITSGAATYAVGQVFRNHFEKGGSLLSFEAEKAKVYMHEQYEAGKSVVKDYMGGSKPAQAAA
jgi:uncharacterized protein (DUF697 family)